MSHVKEAITWAHHDEWARMLCAALTWHFGDLEGLHRVGTLIRELHDLCDDCRPPHDARWDVVIQPDGADLVCITTWPAVARPCTWPSSIIRSRRRPAFRFI